MILPVCIDLRTGSRVNAETQLEWPSHVQSLLASTTRRQHTDRATNTECFVHHARLATLPAFSARLEMANGPRLILLAGVL
ncbi:hypothetical protein Mapa_011184 [Marchantia paleacea]|nr:hypothetical protein Mapa_011184 [Marchantia paleacea]